MGWVGLVGLVGWLVAGWLVAWLLGCLDAWLVGWLAGWLVGWLVAPRLKNLTMGARCDSATGFSFILITRKSLAVRPLLSSARGQQWPMAFFDSLKRSKCWLRCFKVFAILQPLNSV